MRHNLLLLPPVLAPWKVQALVALLRGPLGTVPREEVLLHGRGWWYKGWVAARGCHPCWHCSPGGGCPSVTGCSSAGCSSVCPVFALALGFVGRCCCSSWTGCAGSTPELCREGWQQGCCAAPLEASPALAGPGVCPGWAVVLSGGLWAPGGRVLSPCLSGVQRPAAALTKLKSNPWSCCAVRKLPGLALCTPRLQCLGRSPERASCPRRCSQRQLQGSRLRAWQQLAQAGIQAAALLC